MNSPSDQRAIEALIASIEEQIRAVKGTDLLCQAYIEAARIEVAKLKRKLEESTMKETEQVYQAKPLHQFYTDEELMAAARRIAESLIPHSEAIISPGIARERVADAFLGLEREEFKAIWLNNSNRVLAIETMFVGTLARATIHAREVVKAGLKINAGAVIFAHNHPSGESTPSQADQGITKDLRAALALVDIKLLDHFVVAGLEVVSMAEKGLI